MKCFAFIVIYNEVDGAQELLVVAKTIQNMFDHYPSYNAIEIILRSKYNHERYLNLDDYYEIITLFNNENTFVIQLNEEPFRDRFLHVVVFLKIVQK